MKKILITGGAGFIGSNLTSRLLSIPGYEVICFDNLDHFYSPERKRSNIFSFLKCTNYQFIEGDICFQADLKKIEEKIDVIVHLAAKAGVRNSISDPIGYNAVNHAGTQNLLEFAKNKNIKQFIFASSSSVYGNSCNYPWKEEELLFPISPYASSKLSSEHLGHVYSHLYGIRFLALRLFTVYGPRQRPDLAIHKLYNAIIQKKAFHMFGDGSSSRDYTFVDDTVNGIMAAINYNSTNFEIINIGNNYRITFKELIAEIEKVCGLKAIITQAPVQPGDVEHTLADFNKAKRLLNYQPQTDLKTGLALFSKWYNNQTVSV